VLEPEHGELVRAFVREASLAETVPAPVASLIADDAVEAWQALCLPDSARQRASIELMCSRGDVRARILLQGIRDFRMWWHRSPAGSGVTPAYRATNTASTAGRSAFIAA
jgi:hypothetical protein